MIGGGPGGSTVASLLVQKEYSVLLLEKEKFPRFQIGESLLPYNNDLFQRLGVVDEMEKGPFFPKFGAGFVTADGEVGYTFRFKTNLPPKYAKSYQVERAEFDHLLLKNAARTGVDVREETTVLDVDLSSESRPTVKAKTPTGQEVTFDARFIVDASGNGGVIGRRYGTKVDDKDLKKIAIFAHYRNVEPSAKGEDAGNTMIAVLKNAWFWLIPINKDITSVGIVVDRDAFRDGRNSPEEVLEQSIKAAPYVARRMAGAERTTQVYTRKDFSYSMKKTYGPNYTLVGDAAGFIDPIFSTGVFIAMKSGELAAEAVHERLTKGSLALLRKYDKSLRLAMKRYHGFIANFYRREFLEVFLQPREKFGLLKPVVGMLAGNIFEKRKDRLKMGIFFTLVQIQKHKILVPPIRWDDLPGAALGIMAEERIG
ncbi:MAG TPA: NAD(P)/FAD-dependent oxidoreductase [Thermoanaerobaculia bacterium]|nr:NAD(P)/FAD-dependent oxidoreductase [Thermoanaerobaculia bacterium]